jgi:pyrimidine/purine-5'-nucleotide nucleosidase
MLMQTHKITASVSPSSSLNVLSRHEVARLRDASASGLHEIFRRCSLAVLSSGSETDDAVKLLEDYADFDVKVVQQDRGVRLELTNAPAQAFVDGKMILGVRNHLFAVLRDIIYIAGEM